MNCEKAQKWISLEMDGGLSPRRAARLHAHIDSCSICQRSRAAWTGIGVQIRERQVPVIQTPDAAWADVRRALRHDREARQAIEKRQALGMPLRWATMTLLIMIFGSGLLLTLKKDIGEKAVGASSPVEFVETGLPDATPMVYEDSESGWTVIWIVEANSKESGHAGT